MPAYDIRYDTTPSNRASRPRGPSLVNLKAALTTYNATSYTAARMNQMRQGTEQNQQQLAEIAAHHPH